jgi:hypothetical protein
MQTVGHVAGTNACADIASYVPSTIFTQAKLAGCSSCLTYYCTFAAAAMLLKIVTTAVVVTVIAIVMI